MMSAARTYRLTPPLLLIVATLAVYGVTASFELLFSWDDRLYLIQNDTVTAFTLQHLKEAFSDYYVGNYAPLNILSFMIDHLLWGLHPAGYHLENVLLHLANGLLFYTLLRRLAFSEWQACAAAWIFLLHPVQVETVAWVSQRKSLLAMFFFLAALLCYQRYAEQKADRSRWYLLSVAGLAAALLSKSIAVIFPAVVALYDLTCDRSGPRTTRQRIRDKLPFLAAAAAIAVMAMISQAREEGGGRSSYPGGTLLTTFYTMAPVLLGYIRDIFIPFDFSPYYLVPIRLYPDAIFAVSLAGLLLLVLLGWYLYRSARPFFFWYALFFIALLPVLQLVPMVNLKNDRYLYTPLLGVAVLATAAGAKLVHAVPLRWQRPLCYVMTGIMLALPVLAFNQVRYWRDDITLWSRAVAVDQQNSLAWLQLTKAYTARHDNESSMKAFNRYNELRNRYGPVRGFEKY